MIEGGRTDEIEGGAESQAKGCTADPGSCWRVGLQSLRGLDPQQRMRRRRREERDERPHLLEINFGKDYVFTKRNPDRTCAKLASRACGVSRQTQQGA